MFAHRPVIYSAVMSLSQAQIEEAAAFLLHLRVQRETAAALPIEIAPRSLDDAYAIQAALHDATGWDTPVLKVGCTSQLARDLLSLPHPIAGRVPAEGVFFDGADVPSDRFASQPQIECEFALRVDADGRVDAVAPAMELVGPRLVTDGSFVGVGVVADNSAAAGVVLGGPVPVDQVDLAGGSVELFADGESLVTGVATDVVGGPSGSVSWLAEHEAAHGRTIAAGTWIITGTCTGVTAVEPGVNYRADFGPLGSVSFTLG